MTLKQCYEIFGGDFETTIGRLGSEDFLKRLSLKFLNDSNMALLQQALEKKDCAQAFAAVHTLKGLALNLGFTSLAESSSALTEKLRAGSMDGYEELFAKVEDDYEKTVSALKLCD